MVNAVVTWWYLRTYHCTSTNNFEIFFAGYEYFLQRNHDTSEELFLKKFIGILENKKIYIKYYALCIK